MADFSRFQPQDTAITTAKEDQQVPDSFNGEEQLKELEGIYIYT